MKEILLTRSLSVKDIRLWLLGIGAGLEAICLTLIWRIDDIGHLGMSILFLVATVILLEEKRDRLRFESDIFSSFVGMGLIGWVLWQSVHTNEDHIIRLLSFTSALGVSLLASGFKGLKQYQQELIILFFLGVPAVVLSQWVDLAPITARFGGMLLWYLGFDVSVQGIHISLPNGGVEIKEVCAGVDTVTYVLGIAVVALVMFPIRRGRFLVAIAGALIGFVVNGIRVAMLAVLVGTNRAAFDSLHGGTASYFYGMIGILIFSGLYQFLLKQEERDRQKMEIENL